MCEIEIRTDLALEVTEGFAETNTEMEGVVLEKKYDREHDIFITKVEIINEQGAEIMNKPIGTYITLESQNLRNDDDGYHAEVSEVMAKTILELVPQKDSLSVLVVGLGNDDITPDALGPMAVNNLCITRHINKQYDNDSKVSVSSLVPGVMAKTGMETAEIVKGVVDETKPDILIVIDSLAARNTRRLNTTIQIADTGIDPGSGVGNHRCGINKESVGIPVIAIGIPMVVDAATIVSDTMDNLLEALSENEAFKSISNVFKEFSAEEKYQLIRELLEPHLGNMHVTPKDIDATVKRLSYTISEGLNKAFQ